MITQQQGLEEQQMEIDARFRILWQREFGLNVVDLTPREIKILHLLARGYLNKQIAVNTKISEQTTKNYVSSILKKLNVNNRTQAVIQATKLGIVSL